MVPAELATPDQIAIPAGEEQRITLQTKPGFSGPLRDHDDAWKAKGSSKSCPCAFLHCQRACTLNRAKVWTSERSNLASAIEDFFASRTRGEAPPDCKRRFRSEVLLVPDPNSAVLQPGRNPGLRSCFRSLFTRELSICRLRLPQAVRHRSRSPLSVMPLFALAGPKRFPPRRSSPAMQPNSSAAEAEPASGIRLRRRKCEILRASSRVFEFAWDRPEPDPVAWIIQQRHLEMTNAGPPKTVWRDLNNVQFFEQDGLVGARFENLAPGQIWFLRIVSIDEQGRRSAASPTFMMTSPPVRRTRCSAGRCS